MKTCANDFGGFPHPSTAFHKSHDYLSGGMAKRGHAEHAAEAHARAFGLGMPPWSLGREISDTAYQRPFGRHMPVLEVSVLQAHRFYGEAVVASIMFTTRFRGRFAFTLASPSEGL